jgi:hypothetical protein
MNAIKEKPIQLSAEIMSDALAGCVHLEPLEVEAPESKKPSFGALARGIASVRGSKVSRSVRNRQETALKHRANGNAPRDSRRPHHGRATVSTIRPAL